MIHYTFAAIYIDCINICKNLVLSGNGYRKMWFILSLRDIIGNNVTDNMQMCFLLD